MAEFSHLLNDLNAGPLLSQHTLVSQPLGMHLVVAKLPPRPAPVCSAIPLVDVGGFPLPSC
jgi:hypothetical protein